MRFLDFKAHFEQFHIFSITDIKKWDNKFDFRRLVEWQQKGYINKIINRWYVFSKSLQQEDLLIASNRIYPPSYVSLQWALSYYHLIPEGVFSITAITSLKTHHFNTSAGAFSYKHVKPRLLFGYRLIEYGGLFYRLAEPEKAILDYLYLNPSVNTHQDMEGLRLKLHEFKKVVDIERLGNYLSLFNNKSLAKRVKLITEKSASHA
ncbi:MAG: hypothetical protein ACKO1F_13205 [Flammeovirgaceae bacterium]